MRAGHSFSHLEYEWDCLAWRPWLDLLSRNHTLIRYDTRGTGLSDRDIDDYSFEHLVEDMEAVIEAVGLKQYDLIGITGGSASGHARGIPPRGGEPSRPLWGIRARTVCAGHDA